MKSYSLLQDYQHEMIGWFLNPPSKQKAVLGAVDMGLGKTVCALTAAKELLEKGEVSKILVVAPLRVARDTWPDEISGWEHLVDLRYSVLVGDNLERAAAATSDAPIHIVNRENVVWLYAFWKNAWPYDMLIYDEASRLKAGKRRTAGGLAGITKTLDLCGAYPDEPTPEAIRAIDALCIADGGLTIKELMAEADVGRGHVDRLKKAGVLRAAERDRPPTPPSLSEFGALAQRRNSFKRVIELSGTPSPNGLVDLWGPAFILDQGVRLGRTKHAFHSRWFTKGFDGFSLVPKKHAQKEIMASLKDVMFSMKERDYREELPVRHSIRHVTLSAKVLKEYREFKRELYAEPYDVEAVNAGVLTNKLLQFSNGSLYRGEEQEVIPVHDEKIPALESIIEEAGGASVLVAYSFKFDLDRIRKRFPKAVVFDESPDFVRDWNAGKIHIGLAHPASIGHGLNLQFGGHIAVWYGLTWSSELYQQFNKRLPRPGQTQEVVIHHILSKGTDDERQYATVNGKCEAQDDIMKDVALIP